jgi:transposase
MVSDAPGERPSLQGGNQTLAGGKVSYALHAWFSSTWPRHSVPRWFTSVKTLARIRVHQPLQRWPLQLRQKLRRHRSTVRPLAHTQQAMMVLCSEEVVRRAHDHLPLPRYGGTYSTCTAIS